MRGGGGQVCTWGRRGTYHVSRRVRVAGGHIALFGDVPLTSSRQREGMPRRVHLLHRPPLGSIARTAEKVASAARRTSSTDTRRRRSRRISECTAPPPAAGSIGMRRVLRSCAPTTGGRVSHWQARWSGSAFTHQLVVGRSGGCGAASAAGPAQVAQDPRVVAAGGIPAS